MSKQDIILSVTMPDGSVKSFYQDDLTGLQDAKGDILRMLEAGKISPTLARALLTIADVTEEEE